jgi:hypothetical protein
MPSLDRAGLTALREKYVEMLRLRRDASAGGSSDPRAAMRVLAARFPGALRELDELPLDEIEGRVSVLERALRSEEPPPAWAAAFIDFHALWRAALRVRRLCRGRDRDEAIALLRREYVAVAPEPDLDAVLVHLDAILRPTGGRINGWVHAEVERRHGPIQLWTSRMNAERG